MAKRKKTSRRESVVREEDVVRTVRSSESYLSMGLGLLVLIVVGVMIFNFVSRRNGGLSLPGLQTSKQNEAEPTAKPEQKKYTVVAGDTLWSISEKNYNTGFNWKAIADANNITSPDQLTAGKELIIPKMEGSQAQVTASITPSSAPSAMPTIVPSVMPSKAPSVTPSTAPTMKPSVAPTASIAPTKQPTPTPTRVPTQAAKPTTVAQITQPVAKPTQAPVTIKGEEYTVVSGDNLWTIAERAYADGYKWTEIAKANNLVNPDIIHPGNKLRLPRSK